jgi:hypothetical protein
VATPLALVKAVVVEAPVSWNVPSGAVKVTTTPAPTGAGDVAGGTGAASTNTDSALLNVVPSVVLCGDPPATELSAGSGVSVFAQLKVAVDSVEGDAAITLYVPVVPFAVNAVDVAMPLALVVVE